ncbi:MAG: 30S ribosome-binding factor RbfA [Bacteroidetes bacterium]|nr:MAG: 30S ribosome-binding factor RbfA [Bacteroidota bacterium]
MEESNRQKKIASVLQSDLVDVLQTSASQNGMRGILISVTKVTVTVDLSIAKVYLSIFPNTDAKTLLNGIRENAPLIKHEISQRTRHQLRRMPSLQFFIDDSLEYIDQIDRSLKGLDNPLKNPDSLEKRKKK